MSHEPLPPAMMLRSFLTVGSAFVLSVIALIVCTFGIGLNFFPQFAEYFDAGPEALKAVMDATPEKAIPSLMFWIVVALSALANVLIGFYVIKTAPFSHFGHAAFVAILLFIYYLQMAISDPPGKKSMTLIYMVLFPLALLVGAKWTINRMIRQHHEQENTLELPS